MRRVDREKSILGDRARGAKIGTSEERGGGGGARVNVENVSNGCVGGSVGVGWALVESPTVVHAFSLQTALTSWSPTAHWAVTRISPLLSPSIGLSEQN